MIPTVLWAQRKDKVYLTIDLQDVTEPSVKLDNADGHGKLTFSGKANKQDYALTVDFYKEINSEGSKISISPRHVFLVIMKQESGEHWPRLTKESAKLSTHIKCDWDKWVDEDEEEEGMDKFDASNFNLQDFDDFEGAGPGAEDEDDSDNDDLPDLEK